MRLLVVLVTLSLAAAGRAFAADLPPANMPPPLAAPPPPPRAPATYIPSNVPVLYNWGGLYLGINGGYGFGSGSFGGSTWTFPPGSSVCAAGCTTGGFETKGGIVGSTVGANFQTGIFVFGIEADIDWSDITGTSGTGPSSVCSGCQTANNWLGTARLRSGLALDRALFFVTGGGAFGDIKATLPASLGGGSNDSREFGWTAGAGVEVAITQNWTSKIEYLYVDLANGSSPTASFSPPGPIAASVSFSTNLVRGGLNYKFGF